MYFDTKSYLKNNYNHIIKQIIAIGCCLVYKK